MAKHTLKIFTGKQFIENFIKKETPTQVFFCKLCEILKNIFLEERLRTTASEDGAFLGKQIPLITFAKRNFIYFCAFSVN